MRSHLLIGEFDQISVSESLRAVGGTGRTVHGGNKCQDIHGRVLQWFRVHGNGIWAEKSGK